MEKHIDKIIKKYNKIMNIKGSKGDYNIVENNIDKFLVIEHYMDKYLQYIWNTSSKKDLVDIPFLSAFVKFGLLDYFIESCSSFDIKERNNKERFLSMHSDLLYEIMKEENEEWNIKCHNIGVDIYKGDGKYGCDWPCNKVKQEIVNKYYNILKMEII